MKRILKLLAYIILTLIVLFVIAFWLISTEKYQNILVKKGAKYFSEKLKTRVEVSHVNISFLNHFNLQGVYIEDDHHDTLAYIGNIQLRTSELLLNYLKGRTPVIHSVNIEDVYVNLNRKQDSIWNYSLIEDAFSSGKNNPSNDTITKVASADNPDIDLKGLHCSRVRFFMNDGWRGEDINIQFNELMLDADHLALSRKKIALNNILIENANIAVREYDGFKPEDNSPDDSTEWGTPFNPEHYGLTLKKLNLNHLNFSYRNGVESSIPSEFDENNIIVSDLNLELQNTLIKDDTLFSSILKLNATERCGIAIKELNADLKLSQVQASLSRLKLITNHSVLTDYYEMNYKNFHDFNDYIAKVRMKGRLKNTNISSLDIGFFSNIINKYPINVDIEGDVEGTVDYLTGQNIHLHTRNTDFKGDAVVRGLPDMETTFFDITNIDLKSNGSDLNTLIPQTKTNNIDWNQLSEITYLGSYKGMFDKFNTAGNLKTSLGNAQFELDMDFKTKQPSYSGQIETQNFDIGKMLKQKSIGKLSMKGKINGSGFDLENLNANVDAEIAQIELNGAQYEKLTVNGIVAKKKFDGIFISQDPGLSVNFNGKLDLSGQQPVYNFNSRFMHFDFKKIGLTKESVFGSGYASLRFTGSNIDDFTGSASVQNLILKKDEKLIAVDSILLESFQSGGEKILRLTSSVADAEMRGFFHVSTLPAAIQLYLYHYLPQYIKMPNAMSNQELTYSIQLKDVHSILNMVLPEFNGLSGSVISGNLNTNTQKFSLDANILSFGYNELNLKDLYIVGAGDYKEFDLNANCGNLFYNSDLIIPSFQINGMMASDTASLSIITQSTNEVLGDAFLNVKATAFNDNLYVNILPSNVTIKDDKWQLYSKEQLIFGRNIVIKNLNLENGAQKITFNTRDNSSNFLEVELTELDLHSFTDYLNQTTPSYFGRVSGYAEVSDFINHPVITADVHSTNEVRIDKDTLGIVNAKIVFDTKSNILQIDKSTTIVRNTDHASIGGFVNFKDKTISLKTFLSNTSISFSNQFISDFVKDLKGYATGNVNIDGSLNDPTITGNIMIKNGSLKVIYLGTTYTIDDVVLNFDDRKINIKDFYIKDEREGNYSGMVSGYISHKNFNDIYLNIDIVSQNLLCLNTMEWDNDLFYGYVPAKVRASVNGLLNNITMDITAKPLKGAAFHLPISSSGDASTYDYINFVKIGKDQNEMVKKKSSNYFKMNLNIEATPDAEAYIILDKNTREEIVAKGNGDISLNLDLGNSMNMFGTYVITEGQYRFNFRGVFPRNFTIDEGSKIIWNGNPLEARLDVTAIYQLPKSLPLYPLIAGLTEDEQEISESKKTYPTFINLYLKNELSSPEIKFDITQPSNKAIGTLAYDKLVQIKNDEKELVSQAGVLLLLGEFKSSAGITGSLERGGVSTASDLISNALSSSLTSAFSDITGLPNVSLTVGYKTYSLSETQANINQFNVGASIGLFKDRVVVDVGSIVDVDRNTPSSKGSSTVNVSGDFKAQYLATADGMLRINAFSASNYNAEGDNVIKGGIGVSYKKVFNNLREFLTSKKKKVKTQDTTPK